MPTEYTPFIGKDILKQLMFSMYSDSLTIYREYVQNASDAVYASVSEGILDKLKDGFITITIDPSENEITIEDNATGISCQTVTATLLDISNSAKDGINNAGLYGIGRLVGAGFCRRLIFFTSTKGESIGTKIELNVDEAERLINDNEKRSASEVLQAIATESHFEEEEAKHYFRVQLCQVKPEYPELLNPSKVIDYLNVVAPVEYTDAFLNTKLSNSLELNPDFKDLHKSLRTVQIMVNGTRIQKQYGLKVNGTGDKIDRLEYFKVTDETYGDLAWGWFALTRFSIQISSSDSLQGFRLRKHNIQIGDMTQLGGRKYWGEERGNYYFYGEVHIINKNISPNGARDGLTPSPEANRLEAGLRQKFNDIAKVYKKANEAKKAIDNVKKAISIIQKKGKNAESEDCYVNKGVDVFQRLERQHPQGFVKDMLGLYASDLEQLENEYKSYEATLSKPDVTSVRTAPAPTHNITHYPAKDSPAQSVHDKLAEVPGRKEANYSEHGGISEPNLFSTKPISFPTSETSQKVISDKELIEKLQTHFDHEHMMIIRDIFRIMREFCPNNVHDKQLIDELKLKITDELLKL